jgi:hypothetical protein
MFREAMSEVPTRSHHRNPTDPSQVLQVGEYRKRIVQDFADATPLTQHIVKLSLAINGGGMFFPNKW